MTIIDFLWVTLSRADRLVELIHPLIYYSVLACALLACLVIRFGPSYLRFFFGMPFALTFLATLWLSASGRLEFLVLSLMASCPLMLWASRFFGDDPMRTRLLDQEPPGSV